MHYFMEMLVLGKPPKKSYFLNDSAILEGGGGVKALAIKKKIFLGLKIF